MYSQIARLGDGTFLSIYSCQDHTFIRVGFSINMDGTPVPFYDNQSSRKKRHEHANIWHQGLQPNAHSNVLVILALWCFFIQSGVQGRNKKGCYKPTFGCAGAVYQALKKESDCLLNRDLFCIREDCCYPSVTQLGGLFRP